MLHGRADQDRFHVHGYLEEGTTTTPFVLLASNAMTRYDLAADALRRSDTPNADELARELLAERDELIEYAHRTGQDAEAITDWKWS